MSEDRARDELARGRRGARVHDAEGADALDWCSVSSVDGPSVATFLVLSTYVLSCRRRCRRRFSAC